MHLKKAIWNINTLRLGKVLMDLAEHENTGKPRTPNIQKTCFLTKSHETLPAEEKDAREH